MLMLSIILLILRTANFPLRVIADTGLELPQQVFMFVPFLFLAETSQFFTFDEIIRTLARMNTLLSQTAVSVTDILSNTETDGTACDDKNCQFHVETRDVVSADQTV